MDNNELDKILKQKLKNQITPSKEFEQKIKNTIKEQKAQKETKKQTTSTNKYKRMKIIVSIVEVALIVLMLGISFNSFEERTITIATITDIKPTKSNNQVLARDSEFLIYAGGEDITVESVQKALYIEPALEYSIKKTNNANEYKLTFKQNIPDNTIVKLQYVKDLITENSWAYQTAYNLSVSGTYPAQNETYVSKNTVIEIEFSYASVQNFEEHVEINPTIDGKWEHLGKIWRFTPEKELEDGKYTIIVKNGITAEKKNLKDDYTFSFEVGESIEYYYNTISIDGINTFKPDEPVRIYCSKSNYKEEKLDISKIEIAKFENKENFIEYLQNEDYKKATSLGKYEFSQTSSYAQLTKGLQNGYYAAIIYGANEREMFNCPIQINELSAYAMETERDVLVWVANGENLAKEVKVQYKGQVKKTDSQGIAEFADVADDSETVKYLEIGNTSNKLIVGIYNYDVDNYPYAYLYTDRPLYKNTDTINIWGFVPINQFYDEVEQEFYIELNSEGKQKVKVEEDGNLNYSIELKNHVDDEYAELILYYKDDIIAYRDIVIENYEAQNYTYEAIYDKNYAYAGEKFEFDVKITHITGLAVPNKTVCVEYKDEVHRVVSGEDGIAHFSIEISEGDTLSTRYNNESISIYNGDSAEYTGESTYINIYEINREVYTDIEENDSNYKATLYKLVDDKNIIFNGEMSNLYEGVYETSVEVKLEEEIWTRYIEGYKYNEYTKENEPQYYYKLTNENIIDVKTVETKNGIVEVNTDELPLQEDSEEARYSYELIYIYKDANGKTVKDTQYMYTENEENYTENLGYYYSDYWYGDSNDLLWDINSNNLNTHAYYTYRYFLKRAEYEFSIGETVSFTLSESTNSGCKDISNEGKILRIVFQEDITKTDIIENDNFDYAFTEEDFPGCKITTTYFYNGKFYRMPVYYFDFNEEDRNVDIEIAPDKEQYAPGDEVTLTVKTTNNGKPIKTFVNISVANEAVFAIQEDVTNLTERIYLDKDYPVYTYSTYYDYINKVEGGGGGGGSEPRANFGDTAYFETVYTNSKGIAKVTFKLPDNVTTYRVTAHSANEDLYLEVKTIDIVSTLDFFIQFVEPRNVKTTDDLVLNATSIADEKYNVEYEFKIKELNKTLTTTGTTNKIATVNFGKLPYGTYTAIITGKHGESKDAVEYKFNIVESAQEVKAKTTTNIKNGVTIKPTKNPIVLEIYNKNMNQYIEYVDFIEKTVNKRLDTQIAYNEVQKIKDRYYNTTSSTNIINTYDYGNRYLSNLPNGEEDIVLSALVSYYTDGYFDSVQNGYSREEFFKDNIFEIYLLSAANNEPVLLDLLYLKEEKDISNYNKLLVTLSLEFIGDFKNAKDLYNTIELSSDEKKEYKSITAIIETFISKESATKKINQLIENAPSDEYLRFAILSFFQNNSAEIEAESTVTITGENINETINLNGMQIKTLTINNVDLSSIKFETESKDLMVSYYYQTSLDNIESENISQDVKISIDGELKKGNTVKLIVEFEKMYEGPVRIALPNSLRLAQNYGYNEGQKYYLQKNQIDYATFFKQEECNIMEIPLMVTYEGEYKFENIVCRTYGIYHISNSLDLNISK